MYYTLEVMVFRHMLIIAMCLGFNLSLTFAQENQLLLAVVPEFPPSVIYNNWQPYVDYLSNQLGISVKLVIYETVASFEQGFLQGAPDIAFLNPYHMVMAQQTQGYRPLLSDGSRQLKGVLVVRADDPIQSLQELQGKTVAFPSPNLIGSSLYMRALLSEVAGINVNANYVDTHANSYRHTFMKHSAAGAGTWYSLTQEEESLKQSLKVIYETPGITPHPLAAHPRVSADVQNAVVAATLALYQTTEGRNLLQAIQLPEPFVSDYQRDYAALGGLGLERYLLIP